jgi:hypothetical protein
MSDKDNGEAGKGLPESRPFLRDFFLYGQPV